MKQILNVEVQNYKIIISNDSFSDLIKELLAFTDGQKRLFVVSKKIYNLYKNDLELDKYISKIVVQTSKETKAYEYENQTFAKAEIHKKQLNGALVVLEYTIKIKNNGEIAGYAKKSK